MMRGMMDDLLGVAEALGAVALLIYGVTKADWELVALAVIVIEVTRIRGILTGDEYEAFLKAEKQKKG